MDTELPGRKGIQNNRVALKGHGDTAAVESKDCVNTSSRRGAKLPPDCWEQLSYWGRDLVHLVSTLEESWLPQQALGLEEGWSDRMARDTGAF